MIGKRIKQLIRDKGYKQEEFANIIGVSRSTLLGQIERPSFSTMEKIASALSVPIWQLFVAPEDIKQEVNSEPTFIALIKSGNETYSASSIDEAMEILEKLKKM